MNACSRVVARDSATAWQETRTNRADYRPPGHLVTHVDICFDLALPVTRIRTKLSIERSPGTNVATLTLNGERLRLVSIAIDGVSLRPERYRVDDHGLVIENAPAAFELTTVTEVDVARNAGVDGLSHAAGIFYTYCEPEGFRRLTYFPDRPDVLARYRCTVIADASAFPVLLANGELRDSGILPDGRRFACWEDPYPKASYLFAMVAGRFSRLEDSFITRSGRRVSLAVYAADEELAQCGHGLQVLKRAMAWDEEAYGREYDLNVFNIAVIRGFPGAMECKGLNIYTSEFFLGSPAISTDEELLRIEATVAHEYFHNWTGNRIGCRDWFQLSLKEGFTVYRQQQFMQAMIGRTAARIDDVVRLRELQYPEDDGGMAHAVRPDSYLTINNFYTRTVYEKGAELIRMMGVLAGEERFNAAARAFFERHDGRAATVEDLIETVEQVASVDLSTFRRWYAFIGRPRVRLSCSHDPQARRYSLTAAQHAGAKEQPTLLQVPMQIGLVRPDGEPALLRLAGEEAGSTDRLLLLESASETFVFDDVPTDCTLSAFRGHSAPVQVDVALDDDALAFLAMHDTDGFNRWDAGQRLAQRILGRYTNAAAIADWDLRLWLRLVSGILKLPQADYTVAGRLLCLPSVRQLGQNEPWLDIDRLHASRLALGQLTAQSFRPMLWQVHATVALDAAHDRRFDARRLRNQCLWYLMQAPQPEDRALCWTQFRSSERMEDSAAALQLLVDQGGHDREHALDEFHHRWRTIPAGIDRWCAVQAATSANDCAQLVHQLTRSKAFSLDNTTRLKAIFDVFAANLPAFHHLSGLGYETVVELVRSLDSINPRLAARFLKPFNGWQRLDTPRRELVGAALEQVLRAERISRELYDLASRIKAA